MEKIVGIGEWWKEFQLHGSFRHELFFRYLQISPSYQLAHKVLSDRATLKPSQLPKDFKRVCKVYDQLGDVFDKLFIEWWNVVGRSLPMTSGKNERLLISVDPSQPFVELLSQFTKIVKNYQRERAPKKAQSVEILKNKIQHRSLRERVCLVMARARSNSEPRQVQNWKLAIECELTSKKIEGLKPESKKTQKNVLEREYLSMLVSKNIREALILAENAARGKFPSLEPIDTGLDFDYSLIHEIDRSDSNRLLKILATRGKQAFIDHIDPSRTRRKIKR
jgi:hypothetical protein